VGRADDGAAVCVLLYDSVFFLSFNAVLPCVLGVGVAAMAASKKKEEGGTRRVTRRTRTPFLRCLTGGERVVVVVRATALRSVCRSQTAVSIAGMRPPSFVPTFSSLPLHHFPPLTEREREKQERLFFFCFYAGRDGVVCCGCCNKILLCRPVPVRDLDVVRVKMITAPPSLVVVCVFRDDVPACNQEATFLLFVSRETNNNRKKHKQRKQEKERNVGEAVPR
jgi:hypothetical protein